MPEWLQLAVVAGLCGLFVYTRLLTKRVEKLEKSLDAAWHKINPPLR